MTELVENHHAPIVCAGRTWSHPQAIVHGLERAVGLACHPVDDCEMLERLDAARIEPPRLLHCLDRFVVPAHRAQELAKGAERFDRAGNESGRMRESSLRAVLTPVV